MSILFCGCDYNRHVRSDDTPFLRGRDNNLRLGDLLLRHLGVTCEFADRP
jgi:hypothetical protein